MTHFQFAWVVAGAIIGWAVPELAVAKWKAVVPILFNIGFAFVGAVVAYTIVRHY